MATLAIAPASCSCEFCGARGSSEAGNITITTMVEVGDHSWRRLVVLHTPARLSLGQAPIV